MTIHAVPDGGAGPRATAGESAARPRVGEHRWVAAALVEVGRGGQSRRAEHAARTGHHVLPAATRVDVLEVYCAWCRVAYESHESVTPCPGVATSAAAFFRGGSVRRPRRARPA